MGLLRASNSQAVGGGVVSDGGGAGGRPAAKPPVQLPAAVQKAIPTTGRGTVFSMADVERQAQKWLADAHKKAAEIVTTAREQAAHVKQQAHAEGLAEGRAEGSKRGLEEGRRQGHDAALAEYRKRLSEVNTALAGALQQLEAHRVELMDGAAKDVMQLALAVAGKIVRRAGQIDPNAAIETVQAALRLVVEAGDISIHVHASCLETLNHHLPALKQQWPRLGRIHIVSDDTVAPGGCIVKSAAGSVDMDFQTQLDRIAAELLPGEISQAAVVAGPLTQEQPKA